MRLGLLGPSGGDVAALGRAAEFLLNKARVHRAIYLADDGALDRAVATWAGKVVGDDPSDDGAWARAARIAVSGDAKAIDAFLVAETSRRRLKSLETLPDVPAEGGAALGRVARTIEMIGDRVAVLIHDKAELDEEDILPASLLLFGKSDAPLILRIGARWFVSPGSLGSKEGGVAVVDDEGESIVVTIHDGTGNVTRCETLTMTRPTKMRVQGDG